MFESAKRCTIECVFVCVCVCEREKKRERERERERERKRGDEKTGGTSIKTYTRKNNKNWSLIPDKHRKEIIYYVINGFR